MDRSATTAVATVAVAALAAVLAAVLALDTGPVRAQAGSNLLDDTAKTLTRVGQTAPPFEIPGLDGLPIRNTNLRGKVAVIVFWATWCPSCRIELPRLEKEIWGAYRSAGLAFLAIAREEPVARVKTFRTENHYTMPMAVDPSRFAYERFASEGIPRTYVLSPEGKILFQSVGYDADEFAAMKKIVARELQRLKPPSSVGGQGR